jgi:hypothetical protein
MKPYHGGSAFPLQHHTRNYDINKREYIQDDGMTLRDYFAAKAIASGEASYNLHDVENIAEWAYRVADAMLKVREIQR